MPQMSGPEVASKVAALRPGIRVLYMSGYTDDAVVHHGVLTQEMPFIQKPFSPAHLRKEDSGSAGQEVGGEVARASCPWQDCGSRTISVGVAMDGPGTRPSPFRTGQISTSWAASSQVETVPGSDHVASASALLAVASTGVGCATANPHGKMPWRRCPRFRLTQHDCS